MTWLDWFVLAGGAYGAVLLAIGIRHAFAGRRADRAALKRAAAKWSHDEMPAGRAR